MPIKRQRCRACNHRYETGPERCPACRARQVPLADWCLLIVLLPAFFFVAQHFSEQDGKGLPLSNAQAAVSTPAELGPVEDSAPTFMIRDGRLQRPEQAEAEVPERKAPGPIPPEPGTWGNFHVVETKWNPTRRRYDFFQREMGGTERLLRSDVRGAFLSEDQSDYPEPQSGCGPTALLNLYIWYSKFGLVEETVRDSDLQRYKLAKFMEIDGKMRTLQKRSRTEAGGTNTFEQIVVLDELLQTHGTSPLRLHYSLHEPPLETAAFQDLSQHYRAGILSVRPQNPETGQLEGNHAVLVIRADRTGKITIANWGRFVHGRLRERPDGQWLIPDDPDEPELYINRLTTLIPFVPGVRGTHRQ